MKELQRIKSQKQDKFEKAKEKEKEKQCGLRHAKEKLCKLEKEALRAFDDENAGHMFRTQVGSYSAGTTPTSGESCVHGLQVDEFECAPDVPETERIGNISAPNTPMNKTVGLAAPRDNTESMLASPEKLKLKQAEVNQKQIKQDIMETQKLVSTAKAEYQEEEEKMHQFVTDEIIPYLKCGLEEWFENQSQWSTGGYRGAVVMVANKRGEGVHGQREVLLCSALLKLNPRTQ